MTTPELQYPNAAKADRFVAASSTRHDRIAGMTPLLVAVFAYALMTVVGRRLLFDPDTYFHVAAGNWIWAHGVPASDPFSFTKNGAPWVAHEWLAEVLFSAAFRVFAWVGVSALAALAIAATFALLIRFLEREIARLPALLAGTISFVLMVPHLLARPHVLAMPLLVAWVIGLERRDGETRPPSFLLLPLMTLWANLHASFALGLGLIGTYGLDAVLAVSDWPERRRIARQWLCFFCGAILAALLAPYTIKGLLFAFELSNQTFSLSVVNEWRGTDFSHFQPMEIGILVLLALGFLARIRLSAGKLLLLLGLVHLALAHIRNLDMLALIAPILLARPLAEALPALRAPADRATTLAVRHMLFAGITIAAVTAVALWHGIVRNEQDIGPTRAFAAATEAGVTGPVLNAYDFGGYLVFAGVAPFIDGRVDLYGDQFLHDYLDAVAGDALPSMLKRYHIGWTLLQPKMKAVEVLDHLPGWQRVYGDGHAVVHRRIGTLPQSQPAHP